MTPDPYEHFKRVLDKILYVTISSITPEGEPWNSPVFSAHDGQYNFYWGSHVGSQHSINIESNPKVFLVIYDSTIPPGEGEGVYIQAETSLVETSNFDSVYDLLKNRHLPAGFWRKDQLSGDAPIRLYKAKPKRIWVNGEGESDGNYIDIRTELDLDRIKSS